MTAFDVYILANKYGFSVEYDDNGQIVLYTNVYDDKDDDSPDGEQLSLNYLFFCAEDDISEEETEETP